MLCTFPSPTPRWLHNCIISYSVIAKPFDAVKRYGGAEKWRGYVGWFYPCPCNWVLCPLAVCLIATAKSAKEMQLTNYNNKNKQGRQARVTLQLPRSPIPPSPLHYSGISLRSLCVCVCVSFKSQLKCGNVACCHISMQRHEIYVEF